MTTTAPDAPTTDRPDEDVYAGGGSLATFGALMARDLLVTGRELPAFLIQVVLQPFFTLFVFGAVLGNLGLIVPGYTAILLPGVVGMTVFVTAVQNTALPLVLDFAATREIEDRLMAPVSNVLVAWQKIVFGALRGFVAGIIMVPLGLLMLDGVSWSLSALPAVVLICILAALCGAALGLVLGTSVRPKHVNVVFAAALMPLMFTGAAQFPWFGLENLRWFQVVCALNPLTYVSEALRSVLTPQLRSIPVWIDLPVLVAFLAVLVLLGVAGFRRRAME